MLYKLSSIKKKEWQDKTFFTADLTDTEDKTEEIAFWKGEINLETKELTGDIYTNDKGKRVFKSPTQSAGKPNMERVMEKKAGMIGEAQAVKAQNVSEAQSRNEAMWAKYGACEMIAHHPMFKDLTESELLNKIHILASKIKNDTLDPF